MLVVVWVLIEWVGLVDWCRCFLGSFGSVWWYCFNFVGWCVGGCWDGFGVGVFGCLVVNWWFWWSCFCCLVWWVCCCVYGGCVGWWWFGWRWLLWGWWFGFWGLCCWRFLIGLGRGIGCLRCSGWLGFCCVGCCRIVFWVGFVWGVCVLVCCLLVLGVVLVVDGWCRVCGRCCWVGWGFFLLLVGWCVVWWCFVCLGFSVGVVWDCVGRDGRVGCWFCGRVGWDVWNCVVVILCVGCCWVLGLFVCGCGISVGSWWLVGLVDWSCSVCCIVGSWCGSCWLLGCLGVVWCVG